MQVYKSDGKVIVRDGKVGTEQECCCGECGCSLREGSAIVVTVDGNDIALSSPFSADGEEVEVCSSAHEFLPDSYCESRFLSTADVILLAGCHNDSSIWEFGRAGDLVSDLPENWPTSGIVVLVYRYWVSGSIYPECFGGSGGAARYFFYRMNCDSEGYPTTGELFYDSGTINEFGPSDYACFDCTNQPDENRDCEQLSEPSSVSVVENPLP